MSDFAENIRTLREFNIAMFSSGHTEQFRLEVTSRIIEKYQAQLDNCINDVTQFYRTKTERARYKRENKIQFYTKTGWHEKLGYRAVINIPPTPNSQLANNVRNVLKSAQVPRGYKLMVRETNGISLKNKVCNFINPWPSKHCDRLKCLVCSSKKMGTSGSTRGGDCWTAGVTYSIVCNLCKEEGVTACYEGESSRSCYTRGSRHLRDLETRKPGTPLGDHANQYHSSINMEMKDVTMTCRGSFRKPTQRIVSEGLNIENLIRRQKSEIRGKVVIMNSKTNFFQPGVITQSSSNLILQ